MTEAPLADRILMALGGYRDEMSDEDVRAVQRFVGLVRGDVPDGEPIDAIPDGSITPTGNALVDHIIKHGWPGKPSSATHAPER